MNIILKTIFLTIFCLQSAIVVSHGFAQDTLISIQADQHNKSYLPIQEISAKFFRGQTVSVDSYKQSSSKWKTKPVQAVAYCESNSLFELVFTNNKSRISETIICSPLQKFYRISDKAWVAAHELSIDDALLCKNNVITRLQSKESVPETIKLYVIEVKKYHTFAVGQQKIVTHNMFVPIATTIGFAIPFDILFEAGTLGCMFGPVTFCCSIVVGAVAAAITYQCGKEKCNEMSLMFDNVHDWNLTIHYHDDKGNLNNARAPGLPTEKDGFIPKKNWDGKKVKHPKTGQVGWPDEHGSVWVPTGTGPLAHRGPHWDVIDKKGKHKNILPGGKIC